MKKLVLTLFSLIFLAFALPAHANTQSESSDSLPLPRFVSLATDKAYVRAGPALRYPIKWIYRRDEMPVEVTQQFDHWRKIKDYEGEEGWIHSSLLSGKRTVVVLADENVIMRRAPEHNAKMIAKVEPHVVAQINICENGWCELSVGSFRGWVQRKFLWGIYEHEELN